MYAVTEQVYKAIDGKKFLSEKACKDYEEMIKNIKYFNLYHGLDLCETGLYTKLTHVAVYSKYCYHKELAEQYAYNTFGSLIGEGVQGYGFQLQWEVGKSDRENYFNCRGIMWGGKEYKEPLLFLSPIDVEGFPEKTDYFKLFKLKKHG
jgi:hypothetical protein